MISREKRKREIVFYEKWAKKFERKKKRYARTRLSRYPERQDLTGWIYDFILDSLRQIIESKQELLTAENEIRRINYAPRSKPEAQTALTVLR